jgi:hypothetical protein
MFNWFKNIFSNFEFDPFGLNARRDSYYNLDEIMNQDINDGFKKDREALASDWSAVMGDLKNATKK